MVCETSTSEEDWRELKDYFANTATSLDVYEPTHFSIWFNGALHFMGIENSAKACTCNAKSALGCNTKKELTHVSMIAQKCLVVSVFVCIDLNIHVIQTSLSCYGI